MALCAVQGDPNSDGGGELIASNPQSVFIGGIPITELGMTGAAADSLCPIPGGAHCAPAPASASSNVFVYGNPVHRDGDSRTCGAVTNVYNQSTVFAN